ncbi:uncharacterized protein LOC109858517 [Pseudomyrmex gracilis]|uniref:uncharacterized protein LOC109858517 n=1 Tax=Pseudomyrmex gracilis TaxID=219809 RepID=UPI000995D67A|nr:uncharacterized protein LOC109858517 [Pseudomyrmex gracilis]
MGGPGAGRVNRHELNAVPQSHVGHGERVLGEPPAPGCRCHPPERSSGSNICPSAQQLPPSPPPLTSLHIGNNNGTVCAVIGCNNVNTTTNPTDGKAKKAAAMSSPPKHRRGFDPNDPAEYHRYRRVKTKQRGFVCPTSCVTFGAGHRPPRDPPTHPSAQGIIKHTQACDVRCWIAYWLYPRRRCNATKVRITCDNKKKIYYRKNKSNIFLLKHLIVLA